MDLVKEFDANDFKHVGRYLDEKDPATLLKMMESCDPKDKVQKALIIKQLIYECKHVYPASQHKKCSKMKRLGKIDDDYITAQVGPDSTIFCTKCGLDIRTMIDIQARIEWRDHCASVELWS